MSDKIRPLVAGNWKMNGLKASSEQISNLKEKGGSLCQSVDLLICPPATLIDRFSMEIGEASIELGGQDCHSEASGAFTGDLSAEMLKDAGASYVILGHSERRTGHGESSALVESKARTAWKAGLKAIICIGETESQRNEGKTLEVIGTQMTDSIPNEATASNTVIAYEPVWAIGTGLTPSTNDIKETHRFIRDSISERFGREGENMRILYGGSVKPENASEILCIENLNGALVGGASLKAQDFLGIAEFYG